MNRLRCLAIGTLLAFSLLAGAQSPQPTNDAAASNIDQHMKLLTDKLDLTSDQQARVRPILQEMHDATEKTMQDESISTGERADNARQIFYKADKKARLLLNDDQKKKLDQLEAEMHPPHGD